MLESEELTLQAPMKALPDSTASASFGISVPNGAGSGGYATRILNVPAAGTYYLHGRVKAPSGGDNSFFLEFGGVRYRWQTAVTSSWRWERVTDTDDAGAVRPVVITVPSAGAYELRVVQREDGTALDQLVFTNDANFVPSGFAYESTLIEAESAALDAPMAVKASPLASAQSFVVVPNGSTGAGSASYSFSVTHGADYTVYGRVLAPNGADNSFTVQVDNGPKLAWHIAALKGWRWRPVSTLDASGAEVVAKFRLAPGTHSLQVFQREDGTALDKLLVTADPAIDPDLFDYRSRLRPLARKHLDSPFPAPEGNAFGQLHYGIPALWLNEQTEAGNAHLEAFEQPGVSLIMVTATLAYYMFADGAAPYPGRISEAGADNLAEELWEFTDLTSRMVNAARPPSDITSSENLVITQAVTNYLTAQALRDDPLYAGRTLLDGYTIEQHHDAWRDWMPGFLEWRARKGLFAEVGSPSYAKYTTMALFLLHEFSEDPEISAKARVMLDLVLADWAQDQVSRVRGGGKSRSYQGNNSFYATGDAFNAFGSALFGGAPPNPSHLGPYLLGIDYFPPKLIVDLANRVDDTPFEIASRRPGAATISTWNDPVTGTTHTLSRLAEDAGVLRTTYIAPELVFGSTTIDARRDYSGVSAQNRWHGIVFSSEPDARVFVELEPKSPYTDIYDGHVIAHSGRAMVAQKNRDAHKYNGRARVYFASVLDRLVEENSGWIFVEEGDGFLAVKVVDGGYSWINATTKNQNSDSKLNYIYLANEFSPVILEAGRRADHGTLDAFQTHILARPPTYNGTVLRHTSVDAVIDYYTANGTTLPRIDGLEPDFDMPQAFTGGYIESTFDSGVYLLRYGGARLTLDIFNP